MTVQCQALIVLPPALTRSADTDSFPLVSDMTFTHYGNPTRVNGLVNFEKMHMLAQTMRTLRYCRSRPLGTYIRDWTGSEWDGVGPGTGYDGMRRNAKGRDGVKRQGMGLKGTGWDGNKSFLSPIFVRRT